MLRNPIPLLILAALLWIGGGTYLYQTMGCCGNALSVPPLSITDGQSNLLYTSQQNLLFGLSGATATISDDVKTMLNRLAEDLKADPNKSLLLTGWYDSDEQNDSQFDNLGLARADHMKQYMIGLGVPAAQLLTGDRLKKAAEIHDGQFYGGVDFELGTIESSRYLAIKDATAFTANVDDNFVFARSGFEYKKPISQKLNTQMAQTAAYLKKNPNRSLRIVGLYDSKENNSSALPNLGLGRANNIKSLLVGLGVAATQIKIEAEEKTDLVFADDEVIGPANYYFLETEEPSGNRLAEVEKRLRANPLILRFDTNAETINLSAAQKQYFADLIYYLENKPGRKVNAVGHADNRGEVSLNQRLSRKRAEFVRDYLVRNGIAAQRIQTAFKGADAPIATNDTPEGRQQNRRTEVSIK
ncbi:MAG: OmpA family protein [Bacteroidota bacterium]